MLNWAYDKTTFWGDWRLNTIHFWQMYHNQSWTNDFLSTTTAESPVPFGILVINVSISDSVKNLTFSVPTYQVLVQKNTSISAPVKTLTFSVPSYQVLIQTDVLINYSATIITHCSVYRKDKGLRASIPNYSIIIN